MKKIIFDLKKWLSQASRDKTVFINGYSFKLWTKCTTWALAALAAGIVILSLLSDFFEGQTKGDIDEKHTPCDTVLVTDTVVVERTDTIIDTQFRYKTRYVYRDSCRCCGPCRK